jgi:phage antirepressor YoqD-like protein
MNDLQETVMTVKEIAQALNVGESSVKRALEKVRPVLGVVGMNKQGGYIFTYQQAILIKQEIQKHHNLQNRQIDNITTELEENQTIINAMQILQKRNEEYKRRAEIAESKLIEQQPKVDVYNSICESETLQDLQTVANTIGLKNIFKVLSADKILEKKRTFDGVEYYKPYSEYSPYFELKDRTYKDVYGREHIRPRVYVTGRGLAWLTKKYKVEA